MRKPAPASSAAPLAMSALDAGPADPAQQVDFRSRVGAEKRARMRERLLMATVEAFSSSSVGIRPVIDDVIRVAGVSRGTFYKYFESLDEILPELGQRMADEMVATYSQLFGDVADPAVRVAGGPLLTMSRAGMEPARVAFTTRVDFTRYFDRADLHGMAVKTCLLQARAAGLLNFESLDAAIDFTVGAAQEGAQRIQQAPELDPAYARQLTVMILQGLGMPAAAAGLAAHQAWALLSSRAAHLPWWQPAKLIKVSVVASPLPASAAPTPAGKP